MNFKLNFLATLFLIFGVLNTELVKAACTSPTASAGAMNYFSASLDIKYCNGTSWVSSKFGGISIAATLKDLTPGRIFASAVTVSGSYAYVVGQDITGKFGLTTLNISTPATSSISGSYSSTDSQGTAVTTDDSYLYVIAGTKLLIFSLSTPSNPTLTGSLSNASIGGSKVIVSGNYLYLVNGSSFVILNVTSKTSPTVTGTYTNANINYYAGFSVSGNYAFIASGYSPGYFFILDITSKTSPSLLGSTTHTSIAYPSSVAVYGNYAYVGRANGSSDQMAVVNITTKTAPNFMGLTNFTFIKDLLVSGNYAYVASNGGGLSTVDLNVANPLAITELQGASVASWNQTFTSLAKSGNTLVGVVPGTSYIALFDLTPAAMVKPPEVASIYSASPLNPKEFSVVGSTAVVTDYDGNFWTFNVSVPSSMTFLATNATPAYTPDSYFDGTYLYLMLPNTSEVVIWDLSTPSAPVLTKRFQDSHLSQSMTIQRSGNYLYSVSSSGLSIYDVTSISSISYVATANTSLSWPNRTRVFGNYAYVLDGSSLYIYDVTTKTAPTLVGTLNNATLSNSYDIAVSGNYAFISNFTKLIVVDITTASSPSISTTLPTVQTGDHISISGSYAYVSGGSKFYVVDISAPTAPVLKSTLTSNGYGVALVGNNAFRVDANVPGLRSYNISNPLSVTVTSSVAFNGSYESTMKVALLGNYAVSIGSSTMTITDVSTPSNPILTKLFFDSKFNQARGLVISGNYAYLAASSYFNIVDLTTPSSPSITGSLSSASLSSSRDLKVSGNYAYVLSQSRLSIVDVSTKTAPTLVSSITHASLSGCTGLDVSGNYAYAVCQTTHTMAIIDISNPTSPTVVGNYTPASEFYGVAAVIVIGNYAYVGDYSVNVIDVTNKTAPVLVNQFNASPGCSGCTASQFLGDGSGFYLSANSSIVYWDVTDPINPELYGTPIKNSQSISMPYFAKNNNVMVGTGSYDSFWAFSISTAPAPRKTSGIYSTAPQLSYSTAIINAGNYSFLLSGQNATLNIVDISTPTSPTIVTSYFDKRLLGGTYFKISGNYAYILDPNNYALTVVDLANISSPRVVKVLNSYFNFGFASNLQIVGNYLYIAKNGLTVFDITMPANPQYVTSVSASGGSNIAISSSFAFTCNSGGLNIFNISTPSSPTVTTFTHSSLANCQKISTSGNYLYAASPSDSRFEIFDISSPTSPSFLGSLTNSTNLNSASDVQVSGNYAFISLSTGTITVVDITNNSAPVISSVFSNSASRYSGAWSSPYLFSPNYFNGLDVIRISPPTTLGACSTAGTIDFISANNVFAYCDGTNFIPMGPSPGAGGAGCTSPTASPGAFNYDSTINKMTYCDGSTWVNVGN